MSKTVMWERQETSARRNQPFQLTANRILKLSERRGYADWCSETFGSQGRRWVSSGSTFYFASENDMFAFLMRWNGSDNPTA